MKIMKKISILSISLLMMLSLVACGSNKDSKEEQKLFASFCEDQFKEEMESSYLNMHILFENPDKYGLDKSKVKPEIGEEITAENEKAGKKAYEKEMAAFKEFDRDLLTTEQKVTYDIIAYYIDLNEEYYDHDFAYLGSEFDSMSGVHTQLTTMFNDHLLRNEQDVKDLISLVGSVKPYIDSAIDYTKKQEKKGYMMIDFETVMKDCQKVIDEKDNSVILQSMIKKIDELAFDESAKQTYKQQLSEVFQSSFVGAYENLLVAFSELKDGKNNTKGLANLKNGKDYYEWLFKLKTGSDRSIKDVKALLKTQQETAFNNVIGVAYTNEEAIEKFYDENFSTGFTSYEEILTNLYTSMDEHFPNIGDIQYEISNIDPSLAVDGIAAYYNIPAYDKTVHDRIKVNTTSGVRLDSLDILSTIGHEGFPGHMYQINYKYRNIDDFYRLFCANFPGYTEGYATYIERYAYQYLLEDEDLATIAWNMSIYTSSITAQIDIGIHYDNWSVDDLKEYMTKNQLNVEAAQEMFSQIQANPGAFLSYYVGNAEIMDLYDTAKEKLGDQFDEKEFNGVLLKNGELPFSVLKEKVDTYIKKAN